MAVTWTCGVVWNRKSISVNTRPSCTFRFCCDGTREVVKIQYFALRKWSVRQLYIILIKQQPKLDIFRHFVPKYYLVEVKSFLKLSTGFYSLPSFCLFPSCLGAIRARSSAIEMDFAVPFQFLQKCKKRGVITKR